VPEDVILIAVVDVSVALLVEARSIPRLKVKVIGSASTVVPTNSTDVAAMYALRDKLPEALTSNAELSAIGEAVDSMVNVPAPAIPVGNTRLAVPVEVTDTAVEVCPVTGSN
jgi:hypothetical protein